jgi:hypothetical protein
MDYQKEMQKSFINVLERAHAKVYNTFIKYKKGKDITNDLTSTLKFLFDEMLVVEKDIKIEACDGKSN